MERYIQMSTFLKCVLCISVYLTGLCSFMIRHTYLQNGSCLQTKYFSYILSNIQHIKKCFKWKLSILMIYLSANILFDEALWRLVCTAVSEHTSSHILAWPLISKIVLSINTKLFHENSIKRIKQVTLVHFRWLVYIS